MPFLQQGNSAAVTVPAGQSIRIGAFRAASASITMDLGLPGGPSQTVYDIASTFGPYVVGASVSVSATHGVIEYVVGVAPVLTDEMLVSGSVDPLTGVIEKIVAAGISAGVPTIPGFVGADKPSLVYVRDHAYKQIAGGGAYAAQHQWFKDYGLWPYSITINTAPDSAPFGNAVSPGGSDAMTWAQVLALQADGVEITNHGNRHIGSLRRVNTGFTLGYTGANGTATAYVAYTTGLDPILHCVDSSDHTFDLTNASYDTLAKLKAAVEALTGWAMVLSSELDGTELSKYTLGVVSASAKNCKNLTPGFAISGGLAIRYKGKLARTAYARCLLGNYLQLQMNGVIVAELSLSDASYDTMAELATYVNGTALGGGSAGDWECFWLDNEGVASSSFGTGVEATQYSKGGMEAVAWRDAYGQYVYLTAGMPIQSVWAKVFGSARSTAVANGVVMKNFSDVGGPAPSLMMPSLSDYNNLARVTAVENNVKPYAMPSDLAWVVCGFGADDDTSSSTTASVVATLSALADSPGFVVSPFLHHTQADGSSGRTFQDSSSGNTNYQTEAKMVATLAKVKTLTDAGAVNVLTQQGLYEARKMLAAPSNRIFNPRFINSGASMIDIGASVDLGILMPGWQLSVPTNNFTELAVANGKLTATTAIAAAGNYMLQPVFLIPGKTYNIGVTIESLSYASGTGVNVSFVPTTTSGAYEYRTELAGNGGFQDVDYITARSRSIDRTLTVPIPERKSAYVKNTSVAWDSVPNKTWDLTTLKNIKIHIDNLGDVAVDCSVTSAAAGRVATTFAVDIATDINAAIKATAAYLAHAEYHNIARAENGYLVLEAPYKSFNTPTSALILIKAGASADATDKIFGCIPSSDRPSGIYSPSGAQGMIHPYSFKIIFNAVGRFTISNVRVTEIPAIT